MLAADRCDHGYRTVERTFEVLSNNGCPRTITERRRERYRGWATIRLVDRLYRTARAQWPGCSWT